MILALTALSACGHRAPADADKDVAVPRYAVVARGRIDIEAGLLGLNAPIDGIVTQVLVHVGDQVLAGQPLARFDDRQAAAEAAIAAAELERAKSQQRLLGIQLAAARRRAAILDEAARSGAGDAQSADAAREAIAVLAAQQGAATAATQVARQRLLQTRTQLARYTLKAPVSAEVTQATVQPGVSVSSQSSASLFTLLPDLPRMVRANVGQLFIDRVRPGMQAEVVDDNDQQSALGSAKVIRVGRVFRADPLEENPAARANAQVVECILAFDRPTAARIGQRVMVRLLSADAGSKPH